MDELEKTAQTDDDLTLRVWDGDEAVLGELLLSHGASIERAIAHQFPNVANYAEDIVAEAYSRFWRSRDRYDGKQSVRAYLFKIAANAARNLAAGHLGWQKSRKLEQQIDDDWLNEIEQPSDNIEESLDAVEENQSGICKAMAKSLKMLSAIERAVIEAYAVADGVSINAGALGIELGKQHCDGVPIPAGTIRQHKFRAKNKLVTDMRKRGYELENKGSHK